MNKLESWHLKLIAHFTGRMLTSSTGKMTGQLHNYFLHHFCAMLSYRMGTLTLGYQVPLCYQGAHWCLQKWPDPTYRAHKNGSMHTIFQVNMENIPSSIWLPRKPILHIGRCRWHHQHPNRWIPCTHIHPPGSPQHAFLFFLGCMEVKPMSTFLGYFDPSSSVKKKVNV